MNFLDEIFWGNSVRSWFFALGICLGVAVGLRLVLALLKSRLGRLVKHTRNQIDDVIVASLGRTLNLTLLVIGLAVAAKTLELSSSADLILRNGAGYARWVDRVTLPASKVVDTSAGFRERYLYLESVATHSHGPQGEQRMLREEG